MGLQGASAKKLIHPIVTSVGFWRLPNNVVCAPFRLGRGVPRRLSASVLLAEILVGPLVWKLHWPGVEVVAFVDDIHVLANSRDVFVSAKNLWGHSGRGHGRNISANSVKFPQTFRGISAPFPDARKPFFSANFREVSAEFPHTF